MLKPPRSKAGQAGFTLIELLIICPILMAIIAFMMNYLFNQYDGLTAQNVEVNLQVEAQAITFSMQDDIFFGNAFVSKLNSYLSDPYAPSGGWKTSSTPTVFIISSPALTADHRNANRQPVYINTLGCSPTSVEQENDPLYINIIYWVSGNDLYRRIVNAPPGMSTCGNSYQVTSCPAADASSSCPADNLLTDKLGSFAITYYNASGIQVTTPEQATEVGVALTLTDSVDGQVVNASSNLTMRTINQ